jgi:glycosyltransferase involved in cell wall biosynthesis/GT2 family glycosyltransferase
MANENTPHLTHFGLWKMIGQTWLTNMLMELRIANCWGDSSGILAPMGISRATDAINMEPSIDIVLPVYGAAEALERCLASVFRHTLQPPHHLIVVIDGPQSEDVENVLARHIDGRREIITFLRNETRSGFVASVNRGMANSKRDVILLNSDTEVSAGWVEKLQAAAYSAPTIATVTPLSNSATICSLPEFLEDNLLPAGVSTEMMAEIVERVSERKYPRLPTGIGVCLYIKRSAIDAVGLFDESKFRLGYGEENEFCIRATSVGLEHVADDATFVFHEGQKSFGPKKAKLTRKAMRKLRSIDPTYVPRVAAFMRSDPLARTRKRVAEELYRTQGTAIVDRVNQPLSILHVVHGWPPFDRGGTEQYAWQLARGQVHRHRVSAFARIADQDRNTGQRLAYLDNGVRVRLVVNNFDQRNPFARNALKDQRFEREFDLFLDQTEPDLVHVHHLAGHCASLMSVLARCKIPVVYQVQDWWALCARSNLWRANDTLCPGPKPKRCSWCLPLTKKPPRSLLNPLLYRLRTSLVRRQLRKADAYVMGSDTVRSWYSDAGFLDPTAPVYVLAYGVPEFTGNCTLPKTGARPITFGFIGSLMPHKGVHIAVEAFRGITPGTARLDVWGDPEADPDYTAQLTDRSDPGVIEFKGVFEENRKAQVLGSFDALVVPSVGFESFGIVAREAMSAGVPVIVSRRGALEELGIDGVCGAEFAPQDPADLRRVIDRLIESPNTLENWKRTLPKIATIEEHGNEIEEIYRQVLQGSR